MWSYYGAKTNIVHLYPPPKYGKIIEPFAGTARYSLKYWDREVLLVDKYEVIVKIWKWLQQCSAGDITKLPRLKPGEIISDYKFDCIEAEQLCGFLVGFSNKRPRKTAGQKLVARPNFMNFRLNQIAENLYKIKHWKIEHGTYEDISNQVATWFIDPPYDSEAGLRYVCSAKDIDFKKLAQWCKLRFGQVIVCEGANADWLPFQSFSVQRTNRKMSSETMWTNEPTSYNVKQLSIL